MGTLVLAARFIAEGKPLGAIRRQSGTLIAALHHVSFRDTCRDPRVAYCDRRTGYFPTPAAPPLEIRCIQCDWALGTTLAVELNQVGRGARGRWPERRIGQPIRRQHNQQKTGDILMPDGLTLNKITAQRGISIGEAAAPRRRSRLDAELRPGSDDLPDRLQDQEGAARPDEAGPAVLLPDAGRKGQPRLRRARRGTARRHVPQRRAALGRVDEAVPGDHPVPGDLGRALDGDGRRVSPRARNCAPASPCRWSTSSATPPFR